MPAKPKSLGWTNVQLAGDSTIDNRAYTNGGQSVAEHLAEMLPKRWGLQDYSKDGATCADIEKQLSKKRKAVRYTLVSVGGNDALENLPLVTSTIPMRLMSDALILWADRQEEFAERYRVMLDTVTTETWLGQILVTTIYEGSFPHKREARLVKTALAFFNDIILREALSRNLPIIDLREVMCNPDYYFNPIEPNELGGRMIATAIADKLKALERLHHALRI